MTKHATSAQRALIIEKSNCGKSLGIIQQEMRQVNCQLTRAAIGKIIRSKSEHRKHGSGRPACTTERQDRSIVAIVKKSPKITRGEIRQELGLQFYFFGTVKTSFRTITRRLEAVGLHYRSCRRKPLLTKNNVTKRLQWAREHLNWTVREWKRVLFVDEAAFRLWGSSREYCRRAAGQSLQPSMVQPTVAFGGGKINTFGCISGVGILHFKIFEDNLNGHRYRRILKHFFNRYI